MEHKIGEIFEYNGEWYQCVKSDGTCNGCVGKFQPYSFCKDFKRCVGKIFKKLEKVGEPYFNGQYGEVLQEYKYYIPPITPDLRIHIIRLGIVGIELKQNEEDMEENKTPLLKEDNALTRTVYAYVNGKVSDKELIRPIKEMSDEYPYDKNGLKPFSLEAAKAGKPVCTRDGRKARIICFDAKQDKPIIALVETRCDKDAPIEDIEKYFTNGHSVFEDGESCSDLMMLPEKKEGWINIYHDKEGNIYTDENVYNTEKDAINFCPHDKCRVATVKIEWEE